MTFLPEFRCTEVSLAAGTGIVDVPCARPRLTTRRSTRRLRLDPKYGSGPHEVEVSYRREIGRVSCRERV